MSDKTWKQAERRVAEFFHGERTPLSGGNSRLTRGDIIHPTLYVEVKYRKSHAVLNLWRETKEKADKENKTPVVCLAEKGKKGFFILVNSNDFLKL